MKQAFETSLPESIGGICWSRSSELLAVTPMEGKIRVLASSSGQTLREFPGHGLENSRAVFGPGEELYSCGSSGGVRAHRMDGSSRDFGGISGACGKLAWSPDEKYLGVIHKKSLLLLDKGGALKKSWSGHRVAVTDVCWNPANPGQVATTGDGGACMWKVGSDVPFARFDWGGASLILDWADDGRWLCTGDQTPSVHLYDFSRDYPLHIQGYERKVLAVRFQPGGKALATGGSAVVTVWDCTGKEGPEGSTPEQFEGQEAPVTSLAWSRGGGVLFSGDDAGELRLHSMKSGRSTSIDSREGRLLCLEVSPCGRFLAAGWQSGVAAVYSLQ